MKKMSVCTGTFIAALLYELYDDKVPALRFPP